MSYPSDTTVRDVLVHDKVCKEAGITQKWCGINKLAAFAFHGGNDHDECPSQWAPYESKVYLISQDNILYHEELRKLVHETCGSFTTSRQPPKDVDNRALVLNISHEHRSTIRQCIENLQIASLKSKDECLNDWAELFGDIEVLWHLCELLHFDIAPAEVALPRLHEWVQFQSSDLEVKASEMLSDCESAGAEQRHIDYWDVVFQLIFQGRFEASRALLRLHSRAETPAFREADVLLRSIPVYTVFCGLTISEFNNRWRSWKAAVRSKLKAASFVSHPKLQILMNILGADKMPMKDLKPYCEKWYMLMISSLTFSDPTVKMHELSQQAKVFINEFGGVSNLTQYDHIILSIFDSDFIGVINKLRTLLDGGWTAVHLGNLLYLSNYGKISNSKDIPITVLDSLFLDYGQLLMAHDSLWQVGTRYVSQCSFGKDALSLLLQKIPIGNERKALRVSSVAREFELNNVAESICQIMTMRYLKKNETGNALTWLLMSNNNEFMSTVADHYLRRYESEGEIECSEVLMHLGGCSLTSARLTFLVKYCEFHDLFNAGEVTESAKLLIRLIDSKVAPKFFWVTLLYDSLPFLLFPVEVPVFSQDDTTVLSACVEELSIDYSEKAGKEIPHNDDKLQVIRMALAKNLAKTLIIESCGPPFVSCGSPVNASVVKM